MTNRWIPAALTAAALVLAQTAAPVAARGEDAPPAPKPAAEARTIQWTEGWADGRAAAKKSGKLMLVYVHRTSPP